MTATTQHVYPLPPLVKEARIKPTRKTVSHRESPPPDEGLLLEWVLCYARKGWPVFPLFEPNGEGCSCGNPECKNVGKHPRTPHGFKDATTDEKAIRRWWTKWPSA